MRAIREEWRFEKVTHELIERLDQLLRDRIGWTNEVISPFATRTHPAFEENTREAA